MKILFYRHSIYNRGGDKMVLLYANHLAELGHDVAIMTNVVDTNYHISQGIKIMKMPFPHKPGTILTAFVSRFKDFDVVIVDIVVLANLLSFRNRGKILYFAQDYDPSYYRREIMRKFIEILYIMAFKVFKIKSVAVSENLALKLGRFGAEMTVIPNGIDFSEFYHDPSSELLHLKNNKKVILVFSRRDYRKGFDIAVEVLNRIKENQPELNLMVWSVGDGIKKGEIPFEYKNFGYVASSKLRRLLSTADLFLYPSRHEGLPLFPLEAAACKIPMVVTEATWIMNHLEHAWVSPIGDVEHLSTGVIKLLSDNELRDRIVEGAFKLAQSYDIENSKRLFVQFIEKNFKK